MIETEIANFQIIIHNIHDHKPRVSVMVFWCHYWPLRKSGTAEFFDKDGRDGLPERLYFLQAINACIWVEDDWRWGLTLLDADPEVYMHWVQHQYVSGISGC